MVHRASHDIPSSRIGQCSTNPFGMRSKDLYTMSIQRRVSLQDEGRRETTNVVEISQIRTVASRLELRMWVSPGRKRADETEWSCPRRVAKL